MLGSRTVAVNMMRFLYDPLVHADSTGKIVSGLASSWTVNDNVVKFTIKPGITCSDGSPVTASTVAAEFNNLKDPANASTLIGNVLPNNKYTAAADDATSTFTLTLAAPYLFILRALEFVPIPCGAAGATPAKLVSTASGSGPYTLTEAVASDHYTFTRREGYTWGPDGATTATLGLPQKLVMKIVSSESTAANLLLTNDLNAASIVGQDRARLTSAGMKENTTTSGGALLLFNEGDGRATADPVVRKAIVQAIDRTQIVSVLTLGLSKTPTSSLAPAAPQICDDKAAGDSVPKMDVDAAKAALDAAGWVMGSDGVRAKNGKTLTLKAPYLSTYAGNQPAAELMAKELSAIGIKLTLNPLTQATLSTTLYTSGDYDIWPTIALSISNPSGVFGLLGGPFPPAGVNGGHVANATFTQLASKANATNGQAGCDGWVDAQKALFSNADAAPMGPVITNWVTNKATFSVMQGRLIPTSIRITK